MYKKIMVLCQVQTCQVNNVFPIVKSNASNNSVYQLSYEDEQDTGTVSDINVSLHGVSSVGCNRYNYSENEPMGTTNLMLHRPPQNLGLQFCNKYVR